MKIHKALPRALCSIMSYGNRQLVCASAGASKNIPLRGGGIRGGPLQGGSSQFPHVARPPTLSGRIASAAKTNQISDLRMEVRL